MYRFIIVDDEVLIRRGMLKKIGSAGLGERLTFAGEADNGEDALALIEEANPDIVITDMRMPEMDGKLLLQTLQTNYPDKKVIVVSGYSDYEYMKEAISAKVVGYLLKPFSREEIRESLTKAIGLLDAERSAMRQLERQEHEKQEISYDADLQSLGQTILGLGHKDKAPVLRSSRLQALAEAGPYALMTVYSPGDPLAPVDPAGERAAYVPHVQNDRIGFYVLYGTAGRGELIRLAEETAGRISRNAASGDLKFGVSGLKMSLIGLSEAYAESIEALNGQRIGETGSVLAVYESDAPHSPAPSWERTDELLFFVESGNADKTAEWTGKLFEHFLGMPETTLGEVKAACSLVIREVRGLLHRSFRIDGGLSPSASFESALSGIFDIGELKAHLLNVLPNVAAMMREKNVYSSEHVVDNIKAYIENNCDKTLTLEKISSLFFINPSYCSYLFKEKTGVNFIDYVNRVRIAKAKALLAGTDDKVYKIAKALGYDNAKYFFRVFKKLTGSTPEEYRSAAKKAQEGNAGGRASE